MSSISKSGHAYDDLIVPLRGEVLNFTRKLCRGDLGTAEDITQDAFLRAWKRWDKWEPSHADNPEGSARGWMFRIAGNAFVSVMRKKQWYAKTIKFRLPELLEGMAGVLYQGSRFVVTSVDPGITTSNYDSGSALRVETDFIVSSPEPETCDLSPTVQEAVARLHPDRQAVVELRYVKNMSTKEIAKQLKVPAPTIRTRLVRTHDKLRPLLARHARETYHLRGAGVVSLGEPTKVVQTEPDCIDGVVAYDGSVALTLT